MTDRLDAKRVFGDVITGQLTNLAEDYQRIADQLRRLASEEVSQIGTRVGVQSRDRTATDLALSPLRMIQRETPQLSGLISSAADYDRDVPSLGEDDRDA